MLGINMWFICSFELKCVFLYIFYLIFLFCCVFVVIKGCFSMGLRFFLFKVCDKCMLLCYVGIFNLLVNYVFCVF